MNELRQHKRSDKIKWAISFTAIILLAILVVGICLQLFATNDKLKPAEWFKKPEQENEQPQDNAVLSTVAERAVYLNASPIAKASTQGVSKTLTATVLPADAPNKAVDWSVLWADDAPLKDSNINEYLIVSPASDGATTATVTCIKAFRGSTAIVKVVTREGGFEATCIVSFDGEISSMALNHSLVATTKGSFDGYLVPIGNNTVTVELQNIFNDINPNAYNDVSISVQGYGKILLGNYTEGRSGSSWGTTHSVDLDSMKSQFVSVSHTNGVLTINALKTVESYYSSTTSNNYSVTYNDMFKEYVTGSLGPVSGTPYFEICVQYGAIYKSLRFWISSSVNSVSVNSTLTF